MSVACTPRAHCYVRHGRHKNATSTPLYSLRRRDSCFLLIFLMVLGLLICSAKEGCSDEMPHKHGGGRRVAMHRRDQSAQTDDDEKRNMIRWLEDAT